MVKYSATLTAEIVRKYITDNISSRTLTEEYNVPLRLIKNLAQNFRLKGDDFLIRRRTKRTFSLEFKMSVIDYYQNHDVTLIEVATKYDILACQICALL